MLRADTTMQTLDRLGRTELDGHPVLSLYLDLAPEHFALPATRHAELAGLLANAGHQAAEKAIDIDVDIERIRALLEDDPELMRGVSALAVFSSAGAGMLEAVGLPRPVEPQVAVNSVPWLEPLAEALLADDVGVAVVTRASARLFRAAPTHLTLIGDIHDDVHGRHSKGGWSGLAQSRYQRGVEQEVAWHVDHMCSALAEAHASSPFKTVVLVAAPALWPLVEQSLSPDLRRLLADPVDAELEDAPPTEILAVVTPVLERLAADGERELLARLSEGLGTGGAAAAGLDEVLSCLNDERVETLLLAGGVQLAGRSCPQCGRLSADEAPACPVDGADLRVVDAPEHAILAALRQGAEVHVVRHHSDALTEHGSIAALLRW